MAPRSKYSRHYAAEYFGHRKSWVSPQVTEGWKPCQVCEYRQMYYLPHFFARAKKHVHPYPLAPARRAKVRFFRKAAKAAFLSRSFAAPLPQKAFGLFGGPIMSLSRGNKLTTERTEFSNLHRRRSEPATVFNIPRQLGCVGSSFRFKAFPRGEVARRSRDG